MGSCQGCYRKGVRNWKLPASPPSPPSPTFFLPSLPSTKHTAQAPCGWNPSPPVLLTSQPTRRPVLACATSRCCSENHPGALAGRPSPSALAVARHSSLPALPSVVELVACSVGQGQGPSHLTASCLLLRQACCSSLHCTRPKVNGQWGLTPGCPAAGGIYLPSLWLAGTAHLVPLVATGAQGAAGSGKSLAMEGAQEPDSAPDCPLHLSHSQDTHVLIFSPPATHLPCLAIAHPLLALMASPPAHPSPLVPGSLAAGPLPQWPSHGQLHGLCAALLTTNSYGYWTSANSCAFTETTGLQLLAKASR